MAGFINIPLNPYPAGDPGRTRRQSQRQSQRADQNGVWPGAPPYEASPSTAAAPSEVTPGPDPNFNFYKPRRSYKCVSFVLGGVILLMIAALTAVSIMLGKTEATLHNHLLDHGNSTAPPLDGTTGNNTGLLSQDQIKSCFIVVHNVCVDAEHNSANIPQKNNTIFPDQCNYLIWWMYCQFNDPCKGMALYCAQEFVDPNPAPLLPPPPTTLPTNTTILSSTVPLSSLTKTGPTMLTEFGVAPTGMIGSIPILTTTIVERAAVNTAG